MKKFVLYFVCLFLITAIKSQTIYTFAGNGSTAFSGDGSQAPTATLNAPGTIAWDAQGNVYIADMNHHRIRKIDLNGIISTVVGTGQAGYSGDGGLATSAMLKSPFGIAVDTAGSLYITDANQVVRKVTKAGIITTIAGIGYPGYNGDERLAITASLTVP